MNAQLKMEKISALYLVRKIVWIESDYTYFASNLQLFSRWRCRSIHNTFYRFSYKYIIRVLNELSDYGYDRAVVR